MNCCIRSMMASQPTPLINTNDYSLIHSMPVDHIAHVANCQY